MNIADAERILHVLHHAAAHLHASVVVHSALRFPRTARLFEMQRVGIACLEKPAHHSAFGHRSIANVHQRLALAARVGRVSQHHAERHHLRVGQHAQHMACIDHAGGLERELLRAVHLLEGILEEGRGDLGHLEAAPLDVDERFVGQCLAVHLDVELEVVARPHREVLLHNLETERSRTLVDGVVVHQAFRRLGHRPRRHQQQHQQEQQRRQSIFQVAAVALEVYGVEERHGPQLRRLLLNGGKQQIVLRHLSSAIRFHQLQEVEQLVAHLREMLSYNACSLVVRDTLAEAVHFQQRTHHKPRQHSCHSGYAYPENDAPCHLRQPAKMFQQHGSKV